MRASSYPISRESRYHRSRSSKIMKTKKSIREYSQLYFYQGAINNFNISVLQGTAYAVIHCHLFERWWIKRHLILLSIASQLRLATFDRIRRAVILENYEGDELWLDTCYHQDQTCILRYHVLEELGAEERSRTT